MTETIGTLLRKWRTTAGLSLGRLAYCAGISKATLSRWESGECQPRIPELDSVLAALEVSSTQRTLALSCIEKPRALRHLQTALKPDALHTPPSAGDLLRAMRLRGGWTQSQVAKAVGVGQNTIARWEQSERLPSNEQMQGLCFALEAREEELLALTTRQFVEVPLGSSVDIESSPWQPLQLLFQSHLPELRFWILERTLWRQAALNPSLRPLLADAYACHAHFLSNYARWNEVGIMASLALSLTPRQQQEPDWAVRAALKLASAAVHGGKRPAPKRGLHLLKQWLPHSAQPKFTAWILADMAEYEALAGQPEHGVTLAQQAVQQTADEQEMRRIDLCRALNAAGRPDEALREMLDVTEYERGIFVYAAFVRIESHLQRNEMAQASHWMDRVLAEITRQNLHYHSAAVNALMQRFEKR